jgi:hypothetical protein
MRRFLPAALPLALLAACGTPQQQCINSVTRDLRVVNGLILETQANIQRGYAYATVTRTIPQYVDCTPRPTEGNPEPKPQMCLVNTAQTFRQPVAIDLAEEQKKLDQLLARRETLQAQAQPAIAACQAQYPEPDASGPAAVPTQP